MNTRRLIAVPMAAVLAVGFVASADGALKRRATVRAAEDNQLAFTKKRLRVRRGRVTITMTNPSSNVIPHAIAVARKGPDKVGREAAPGERSRVRLKLRKGRYTFYCPVAGHRGSGMKGRLVVK